MVSPFSFGSPGSCVAKPGGCLFVSERAFPHQRLRHADRPFVFLYIVDPDKGAALLYRIHSGDQCALFSLVSGKVQGQPDHGFAGSPEQDRESQFMQDLQMIYDSEVHLVSLAESHTRIQDDPVPGDARRVGNAMHPRMSSRKSGKKSRYSADSRLCMRQQAAPLFAITEAIRLSYFRPQISLTRSAPARTAASATALLYVSMETGTLNSFFQALDDRDDPADLFLIGDLCVSGARGFPAHVDDVRALGDHPLGMGQRRVGGIVLPAV